MNFGPKNTKVYVVDLFSGQITDYMTSKMEASVDVCNGDCFLKLKEAEKKGMKIIGENGGGLLDMTNYVFDGALVGQEDQAGELKGHLRLKVADKLANFLKENDTLDCVMKELDPMLKDDETESVNGFVEWLDNDDTDGSAPSSTNFCKIYKEEFVPFIEEYR